jgi:CubicO group peptidase (beta-lactamase class C family)
MPLIFVLCLFATPRTLWASEFVSPNAVGSIDAPNVEPLAVQIDEVKLKVFLQRAVETDTQVLIVEKNNKTVVEKYWKEPSFQYQIHSISKSLVSLAIGKLIDEDKLKLEDFASKWFSTWSGEKNNITLRHLLTHTSGLEDDSDTIEKSVNSLQASVDLPLKHSPLE